MAAGLFSAGGSATAQVLGSRPQKMPADRSIYRLSGKVTVNDTDATLQTRVFAGDTVRTGPGSEVVFVVGGDSMLLRANSNLELGSERGARSLVLTVLRLVTGAVLSVSRGRRKELQTQTALMGIRGTGFYVEANPDQTYFCTCYGVTDVQAIADPDSRTTVAAKHHDRPLYIVRDQDRGNNIRNAPFINHTDQELTLIETLVGRTPPFVFPKSEYKGPRRAY